MNKEIKKLWVEALRSKKYKQGTGFLCEITQKENLYCCLGVLCEIAPKEISQPAIVSTFGRNAKAYNGESCVLPHSIRDWAELDNRAPYIKVDEGQCDEISFIDYNKKYVWAGDKQKYIFALSTLNDSGKFSFDQIANLIEEQL